MLQHVLITGASSGLGAEFARQLAPRCQTLILVARRGDRLDRLRTRLLLQRSGITVRTYIADLSDEAQLEAFLQWLEEQQLRVDFLINNAGLGDHGRFDSADWERIRAMLSVNITALTRLTHGVLPLLRKHSEAAILNVSSVAGLFPLPRMAVYAATKAYVNSFGESLRAELRGTGVSVTTLCPGPVDTEFGSIARRRDEEDFEISPDYFKVPAAQVVDEALAAVYRDRPRIIPGWVVAVSMTFLAALPLFLLRPILNERARRR